MALIKRLRDWEIRYPLNFVGLMVGVLGTIFAVYTYLQKSTPDLRVEVVSNVNLIDVKEDVGKIDIFFNGSNLREKQQTLALVTIKISNVGASPILKSAYDETTPLGIIIKGGEITKAEVFRASSDYLSKQMTIQQFHTTNSDSALFAPVIFEPEDFVWVKLLILHNEKTNFEIKPTGKIAGVKSINLLNLNSQKPPSYEPIRRALAGDLITQLIKIGVYGLGLIFIILFVIWLSSVMDESRERADRKSQVAEYQRVTRLKEDGAEWAHKSEYFWVQELYVRYGNSVFAQLKKLFRRPENALLDNFGMHEIDIMFSENPKCLRKIHNELKQNNVVKREKGGAKFDENFCKFVTNFERFLENKYEISKNNSMQIIRRVVQKELEDDPDKQES